MKNFENFTNLYEIQKTLRFELIPSGAKIENDEIVGEEFFKGKTWTEYFLAKNEIFGKDKIVYESYKKIKPFLDKLHTIFINESLKDLKLDFGNTETKFLEWQKENDKTKKDKLKEEIFGKNGKGGIFGKLRNDINKKFEKNGKNWKDLYEKKLTVTDEKGKEKKIKIKGEGYKILLSDTNLDILSDIFSEEKEGENVLIENIKGEKVNLFKSFKGFTTYFSNFNNSRENFYKDDGKAGRIATRIIDENLIFFLKNKKNFDEKFKNENYFSIEMNKVLENFGENLNDFFSLEFYNKCFTGTQIEYYNQIIGELNSVINSKKQADYSKHIQDKKEKKDTEFKKQNYPLFRELYKQILSEEKEEQKFIEIENFSDIKKYLQELEIKNTEKNNFVKEFINDFVENFEEDYDLQKIYISKISLNTISAKFFGSQKWFLIQEDLLERIGKKNKNDKKDLPDFLSLFEIKNSLIKIQKEHEEDIFKKDFEDIVTKNSFEKFLEIFKKELFKNIENSENNYLKVKNFILNVDNFSDKKEEKEIQIEIIKNYLDSNLNIYRMMKYFALEKEKQNLEGEFEANPEFYDKFKKFYIDNEIIQYYNEFRNFLTKKPYSEEKIKLNFENGSLIDGWDKNKEPDNYGTILRKNGKYFLALQVYKKKNIFYNKKSSSVEDVKEAYDLKNGESFFEKVDYKFFPDASKMIPKCGVQIKEVKNHFLKNDNDIILERGVNIKKDSNIVVPLLITKNIFELNNFEYKKSYLESCGENFDINQRVAADSKKQNQIKIFQKDFYKLTGNYDLYRKSLNTWIDFCQRFLDSYSSTKEFNLKFKKPEEYESLDKFYDYVNKNTYSISFRKVSEKYIYDNVKRGNIYLFEIYNKDFSSYKTGKENLHTMYFKGLFEENNLKNIVLKLNGQAEIFKRKSSLEKRIDSKRKVNKDIIDHKRYTKEKLFFHCPISLNFSNNTNDINAKILEYLNKNEEINIIGIDRGEKHLAYFSVIDQKGNILKDENGNLVKGSFNTIELFGKDNKKIGEKNYYEELVKRENERKQARGSWKTIGNIKDLKQGYISQIVHKLSELIIKYNAIVIFEDLNSGFKRGRQKIERQIYQKLEKALIEKLNYLTFKDRSFGENGHYLSAYQLTEPFETFEKIGKQTGVIFYTDPSYTSTTCPKCGFRKDLYLKYSNLKNAIGDIEKIDSITFEGNKFIFEYKGKKVFSNRDRKRNISSEERDVKGWITVDNDITKNLIDLFEKFKINFSNGENIILQIQEKNEKELYKKLFENFNAILSIRNSTIGDNSRSGDFICCPCCDFDSRVDNEIGIENGDDNGAYNTARKGIIILEKINLAFKKYNDVKKIKWKDISVTQEDWDKLKK
ncbi:hypothetical protein DLH72_00110 [Candidatus Gracilibacteria bacterium]|nr:MAG: hypothetical protein DLH72_00110 [Candidatus Gracilibacteria bacterium]